MSLMGNSFGTFGGVRVVASAQWPKIPDGTRTVRFPAHPFIRWLARFLPITPYVEATYPKYRDADPLFDERTGVIYCSLAQERAIRAAAPSAS